MIRLADVMYIAGVVMVFLSHTVTNFAFWYLTQIKTIGATVQEVALAFEANPEFILIANLNGLFKILFYLILPAFIISAYWVSRKAYIKTSPSALAFMGTFMFFVGLLNLTNDVSNLAGLLLNPSVVTG